MGHVNNYKARHHKTSGTPLRIMNCKLWGKTRQAEQCPRARHALRDHVLETVRQDKAS